MKGYYGIPIDGRDYIHGDLLTYESGEMAIIPHDDRLSKFGYECTEMCKRIQVDPETVGIDWS